MIRRAGLAAALALALAGCAAAELTPLGAAVEIGAAPRPECKRLGPVRAALGYNGRSPEENLAAALVSLRNEAATLGGDALVVTSKELGSMGIFGAPPPPSGGVVGSGCPNCVAMEATAYRCGARAIAPAAPSAKPIAAPGDAPRSSPPR